MGLPKGFHWSVTARKGRVQEQRQTLPYRGAFFSTVVAPLENERVAVDGFLGEKITSFAYPFASTNSWIRGQPEANTVMLSILGSDSLDLQPVGYYDSTKTFSAQTYNENVDALRSDPTAVIPKILPYRSLTPGDIDQGSNFAQTFHGLKDVYQARGGLSHLTMTSQSANVDTPLFQVHGPTYRISQTLADEVRFGVVRRATNNSTPSQPALIRGTAPTVPPLSQTDPAANLFAFAKEYTVVLNRHGVFASRNGNRLIDHRQGTVVEDDGQIARSSKTQQELRARFRWFSPADETRAEVDDSGNWSLDTSGEAFSGGKVNIPTGNYDMFVGQGFTLKTTNDINLTSNVGSFISSSTGGFDISTKALGEITGNFGLNIRSQGAIQIESALPAGIRLGSPVGGPMQQFPVLVGNPAYLSSLNGYLGSEAAFNGVLGSYGAAAAQAWSAVGALTIILDPSLTVASLCLAASAAATAMSSSAPIVTSAITGHMVTLGSNPTGFLSNKTISE